ncbi:hypothetical protein SprV_0501824900 [Sparganum proliferum]
MMRQLHYDIMAAPRTTEAFTVTKGVKQRCVLMDAYRDERPRIRIAYRMDGQLLNRWRVYFQSRVNRATAHGILFAYDCELNTTTEEEMQRSMDLYASDCAHFGQTISSYMPVVTHQPPPNAEYSASCIRVDGNEQKTVDTFTCLGSKISRCIRIDGKLVGRIAKVS